MSGKRAKELVFRPEIKLTAEDLPTDIVCELTQWVLEDNFFKFVYLTPDGKFEFTDIACDITVKVDIGEFLRDSLEITLQAIGDREYLLNALENSKEKLQATISLIDIELANIKELENGEK